MNMNNEIRELNNDELDSVSGGQTEFGIFDAIADTVGDVFGIRDSNARNIIHHFTDSGSVTNPR
jgi:bacteriocin-like protein